MLCARGGVAGSCLGGAERAEGCRPRCWSAGRLAAYISRSICTPTGESGLAYYVPPATPSFTDVATDYWAYKYIEYAVEANIVGGYEDGTYHPEYVCTRDQMAVYIARAFNLPT